MPSDSYVVRRLPYLARCERDLIVREEDPDRCRTDALCEDAAQQVLQAVSL